MKYLILCTLLLTSSCSTLNRQRFFAATTGVVLGSVLGGVLGKSLSPDKLNEEPNTIMGATIGGLAGGALGFGLGDFFWHDDPENRDLPNMILDNKVMSKAEEVAPVSAVSLVHPEETRKIPLSNENLKIPEFLKGKLKNPNLIIYEVPTFEEIKDGGRTIYHEAHNAYEYVLEDSVEK